jgi:hypothetical protein
LKRNAFELHFAANEQLLEAIVESARQHHTAQDLAPFLNGERGGDRRPREESVTSSSSS